MRTRTEAARYAEDLLDGNVHWNIYKGAWLLLQTESVPR